MCCTAVRTSNPPTNDRGTTAAHGRPSLGSGREFLRKIQRLSGKTGRDVMAFAQDRLSEYQLLGRLLVSQIRIDSPSFDSEDMFNIFQCPIFSIALFDLTDNMALQTTDPLNCGLFICSEKNPLQFIPIMRLTLGRRLLSFPLLP